MPLDLKKQLPNLAKGVEDHSAYKQRSIYLANSPQEEFMVPLLNEGILGAMNRYGRPHTPMAKALDIGCGGQPFRKLIEQLGYQYFGLDLQENPGVTLDYKCRIDSKLPSEVLSSAGYSLILITEVAEHLIDWSTAFENLFQLCAPGGRVILTCPFFYPLHEQPYDYWRPTVHALRKFAEAYGFSVLEVNGTGSAWDVLGTLLGASGAQSIRPTFFNRCLSRSLNLLLQFLFRISKNGWIRRRIRLKGELYLANLAVLERLK